ncbi:type II toxin-antitoxin system prevent-host-death family antitoxin [uncultured Tateyamaria sp.]|uniref:type II toxin-antitoxin system prevent-host-death family antitoxin n=1 Tax=uncultured Tateyamaria sp. TaxID=455651 RepID=UPI002611E0EA|nr:type II toxin-antitoxin system prevent-host-death family antitoxin [uncultured Tateyamaria sp.]
MNEPMRTATVSMLRRRTKELLKLAAEHPILITRYGKPAFVLMSVDHYNRISEIE